MNEYVVMIAGNALIGTALISTILVVLFFTYVVKFAHEFANAQTDIIARSLANDVSLWIPSTTASALVDNIKLDDTSQEDDARSNRFAQTRKSTYVAMGIALAVVTVISIPLFAYYPGEQLLVTNAVSAGFVGLALFSFFQLFVKDYILADPNYVRNLTINSFLLKLAKRS